MSAVSTTTLDYELRVSARAKRATLRVLPGRGLVVTIPRRMSRHAVPALVERHRRWALHAIAELESRTPLDHRQWPPQVLHLKALGRRIDMRFEPESLSGHVRARWESSSTLVIDGSADAKPAVASAIASSLKQEARAVLLTQLSFLSTRHGLVYRKAMIRGQRSVWGSYSSTGTLSLNYKLLFLPPELVEYVILHELAHTRYLDHSDAFWDLLEQLVHGARARHRQLSRASIEVPPWLEANR